jgi:thiamine-monophosphate kinase
MEKHTEISTLGEFGLIDKLLAEATKHNKSTLCGAGDDAAVLASGQKAMLLSTDLLLEGINFDLTYFPLKHLGYKAVVVASSDILAMNALPSAITVSVGVSSKFGVEQLEELYAGIHAACDEYSIDLVGGDTSASMTGFVVNITAVGRAKKCDVSYRSGAQQHDLICITGDLGASYMGLRLLERESRVLQGLENPQPQFDGHEYLLERYLKPRARYDMIESLRKEGIVPTSMIDITDGLASEVLQICKASKCGARIYLDHIPIAKQTMTLAEEMNLDPVVAALNGGEDYELLFTVPLDKRESIIKLGCIDIIGHITAEGTGAYLVTPDGNDIALKAQGFTPKE